MRMVICCDYHSHFSFSLFLSQKTDYILYSEKCIKTERKVRESLYVYINNGTTWDGERSIHISQVEFVCVLYIC